MDEVVGLTEAVSLRLSDHQSQRHDELRCCFGCKNPWNYF